MKMRNSLHTPLSDCRKNGAGGAAFLLCLHLWVLPWPPFRSYDSTGVPSAVRIALRACPAFFSPHLFLDSIL